MAFPHFDIMFEPTVVEVGVDVDGDVETAITLSWGPEQTCTKVKKMTRQMLALQRALKALLAGAGEDHLVEGRAEMGGLLAREREVRVRRHLCQHRRHRHEGESLGSSAWRIHRSWRWCG